MPALTNAGDTLALTLVQGISFSLDLALRQPDRTTPIDLSGATLSAIAGDYPFTVAVTDPTSGAFTLSLLPSETQALRATRRYGEALVALGLEFDLRITWPSGEVESLARGRVDVESWSPPVTP